MDYCAIQNAEKALRQAIRKVETVANDPNADDLTYDEADAMHDLAELAKRFLAAYALTQKDA